MLFERSYKQEIIDLGPSHYSEQEYRDCLKKLEQIGRWLGGDRATLSTLHKIKPQPKTILDVGCGGGAFTLFLARQYPEAQITGIDLNPLAIDFANDQLKSMSRPLSNVKFILKTSPDLDEPPKSYDVVMSTLVCHHFDDLALVDFLQRARGIAKHGVLINDLHRHPIAYGAFKFLSQIFFYNRLIQHDGLLSIKRSFTSDDWKMYLRQANIPKENYCIQWHWAFRWIVFIHTQGKSLC